MIELMFLPLLVALICVASAGALASAAVKLTLKTVWKDSFDFSSRSLVVSTLLEFFIMGCTGFIAFMGLERFLSEGPGHPWRIILAFATLSTCIHVPFAIFVNMTLLVPPSTDVKEELPDQGVLVRAALLGLSTPVVANILIVLLYLQIR